MNELTIHDSWTRCVWISLMSLLLLLLLLGSFLECMEMMIKISRAYIVSMTVFCYDCAFSAWILKWEAITWYAITRYGCSTLTRRIITEIWPWQWHKWWRGRSVITSIVLYLDGRLWYVAHEHLTGIEYTHIGTMEYGSNVLLSMTTTTKDSITNRNTTPIVLTVIDLGDVDPHNYGNVGPIASSHCLAHYGECLSAQ